MKSYIYNFIKFNFICLLGSLSLLLFIKPAFAVSWTITGLSVNDLRSRPHIITDNVGDVVIVYYDNYLRSLMSYKSTDQGSTWTQSTIDGGYSYNPRIAVDNNNTYLYISWYSANGRLYFIKPPTTKAIINVLDVFSSTPFSSVAADSNNNYVIAYQCTDAGLTLHCVSGSDYLQISRSTNGGSIWTPSAVGGSGALNQVAYPQIIIDNDDDYYLAFINPAGNIAFFKSTDDGANWTNVSTAGATSAYFDMIRNSLGHFLIAYVNSGIKLAKTTDDGANWTTYTVSATGSSPSVAQDNDGNYLVVYKDGINLQIAISSDGGSNWSTSTIYNGNEGTYNSLTVDDHNNYMVAFNNATDTVQYVGVLLDDAVAPSISLTALSPDPTIDTTPTFTGTTTDALGTVASVEFQIDSTSGSWTACTCDDGTCDEASEAFTCAISSALTDASHTIYVRSTDDSSNVTTSGSETTDIFTVDTTSPASMTLVSPTGYSQSNSRPTLVFRKSSDANSISSYTVSLDADKNRSWTTSGIPASGNGSASYVWKDSSDVKIEFFYENSGDATNDEVRVYFKGVDTNELTEGKHSWKVIAYDNAGNSKETSAEFYLDKTAPSISELSIVDNNFVQYGQINKLSFLNRLPSFSGKASDPYIGSEVTNSNGSKDTFAKVTSSLDKLTLILKRLQDGQNPLSTSAIYSTYLTKDYSLANVQDSANVEKYQRFLITAPSSLIDGYYQGTLAIFDQASHSTNYTFYLSLNYQVSPLSDLLLLNDNLVDLNLPQNGQGVPSTSDQQPVPVQPTSYDLEVKVVNQANQPVWGAQVTLHSQVQQTTTDREGIARFVNVEPGPHQISIAYQGYQGTLDVDLQGKVEELKFEVQVVPQKRFTYIVIGIIAILIILITGLFAYIIRRKN